MQEINTKINSRRSVCILVNILLQSEGQETTRKLYQNNSSVKYHGDFISFYLSAARLDFIPHLRLTI